MQYRCPDVSQQIKINTVIVLKDFLIITKVGISLNSLHRLSLNQHNMYLNRNTMQCVKNSIVLYSTN